MAFSEYSTVMNSIEMQTFFYNNCIIPDYIDIRKDYSINSLVKLIVAKLIFLSTLMLFKMSKVGGSTVYIN